MWILIQSYKDFCKNGIKEPPEVLKNTTAYKEESDCVLQFINESLENSLEDKVKVDDVYHMFREWFKNSGSSIRQPTKKDFIKSVGKEYGPPSGKFWKGVAIVNSNLDEDDDEDD